MAEINDLNITDASNTTFGGAEGMNPSTVNNIARSLCGALARGFKDSVEGTIDSGGGTTVYTVAANRDLSGGYYDGMKQGFHVNATNTGAVTLNIDGVGAKAVTKHHDVALVAGDWEQHQYVEVVWSADDDKFQMVTPEGIAPLTGTANSIDGTMIAIGSDATGDILYYDGTDYVVLAAGTDGYHLRANGAAAPSWEDLAPRSYLAGLTLSNDAGDTDHDINVTAGVCKTADGLSTMTLSTEQTKQIDATWATGDDAGGLSSSLTLADDTWYHVHLFTVGATVEVGFDTSATAANLIADHGGAAGKYRRIGSVHTFDSGASNFDITQFTQIGDQFYWDVAVAEFATDFNSTAVQTTTLDVPTGIEALALCSAYADTEETAAAYTVAFWYPGITDPTSAGAAPTLSTYLSAGGGGSAGGTQFLVRADTSAQIQHRNSSDKVTTLTLHTYGWFDDRGRNA